MKPDWYASDGGKVFIEPEWKRLFIEHGLDSLHALSTCKVHRCMRKVSSRCTVQLVVKGYSGCEVILYLKKYYKDHTGMSGSEQAFKEFDALSRFKEKGLPVPRPLVIGGGEYKGIELGVLVTEEIPGGIQADHLLGRVDGKNAEVMPVSGNKRLDILQGIGRLAGKMHGEKWVHRDMYLCHFFPALRSDGRITVYIIDLQRAFMPPTYTFHRWRLKDLGALYYSSMECDLNKQELDVLFSSYFSVTGIVSWQQPIWKESARLKALWIAHHYKHIRMRNT
jgi:hypothetical protein